MRVPFIRLLPAIRRTLRSDNDRLVDYFVSVHTIPFRLPSAALVSSARDSFRRAADPHPFLARSCRSIFFLFFLEIIFGLEEEFLNNRIRNIRFPCSQNYSNVCKYFWKIINYKAQNFFNRLLLVLSTNELVKANHSLLKN